MWKRALSIAMATMLILQAVSFTVNVKHTAAASMQKFVLPTPVAAG